MASRLLALLVYGGAAIAVQAQTNWVREIEITSEPEAGGQQDFNVRITPARTHACSNIEFECVYRQVFPWTDAAGRKSRKIHEPVVFTYRRPDVKAVNDLDLNISFRVPVSLDRLGIIYGPKVFNGGFPVAVDRMRISGRAPDGVLWSCEVKASGKHDAADLAAAAAGSATNEVEDAVEEKPDVLSGKSFR
jgi:hypothetical protein